MNKFKITSAFFIHEIQQDDVVLRTQRMRDIPGAVNELYNACMAGAAMHVGDTNVANVLTKAFTRLVSGQQEQQGNARSYVAANSVPIQVSVDDVIYVVQILNEDGRLLKPERDKSTGQKITLPDEVVRKMRLHVSKIFVLPAKVEVAPATV